MDASVLWIVSIGCLTMLLGCCVLFALRQITVLRESIDEMSSNLKKSKEEAEASRTTIEELRNLTAMKSNEKDTAQIISKLKSLEVEVEGQKRTLTDMGTIIEGNNSMESPLLTRGMAMHVDMMPSQSPNVNASAAGPSKEVVELYEEIAHSLRAQEQVQATVLPTARTDREGTLVLPHRQDNDTPKPKGLSLALPPPIAVYVHITTGLHRAVKHKRKSHVVRLGRVSNDIELVFVDGELTSAAVQALGSVDPNEIVIPIDLIDRVDVRSEVMPFDRSDCIVVDITHRGAIAGVSTTARANYPSLRKRDPHASVLDVQGEQVFSFSAAVSPQSEEWLTFISQRLRDRVHKASI